MIANSSPRDQGRARGLYDEQLQRQQQEKMLFRQTVRDVAPLPADPIPLISLGA